MATAQHSDHEELDLINEIQPPDNIDKTDEMPTSKDSEDKVDQGRPRRLRNLTTDGQGQFDEKKNAHKLKISIVKSDFQMLVGHIETYSNDLVSLEDLKLNLIKRTNRFDELCKNFLSFLTRENTTECMDEIKLLQQEIVDFSNIAKPEFKRLNDYINALRELENNSSVWSSRSRGSRSSGKSSRSSVIVKTKAKAEAAKVRAHFAERETELLKQSALHVMKQKVIKADLVLLNHKKEAAAIEAEAEALESELQDDFSQVISDKPALDSKTKTAAYVDQIQHPGPFDKTVHFADEDKEFASKSADFPLLSFVKSTFNKQQSHHDQSPTRDSLDPTSDLLLDPVSPKTDKSTTRSDLPKSQFDYCPADSVLSSSLDPKSTPFQPKNVNCNASVHQTSAASSATKDNTIQSDFTSFLLKRDLLHSRLNTFDGRPEFYPSWKASFRKIVTEIHADASEEIDLLVKWTCAESQTHVQSIKAANMYDPNKALRLIWERLDERYGSPEQIDRALKKKLDSFQRITTDYSKLYVLSDILAEILSVKENENYGALFSYFDCSIGVKPIVSKLPLHLQERWTRTAVEYNERHGTIYPPFRIFADFVHKQSRIKNNPSFSYDAPLRNFPPKAKSFAPGNRQSEVRVRANDTTELVQTNNTTVSTSANHEIKCPIHGTKHSLNECRSFQSKSIMDRRKLLKQHKMCFRCCNTNTHQQRDCTETVKCSICQQTNHATALHMDRKDPTKHGGEQTNDSNPANNPENVVQAKCTQICNDRFGGKSCAKIVLVNVFLQSDPENKIQAYAVLDDQSNRTLGKSELFDYFGSTSMSDYVLSTCNGKTQNSGRKLNGLIVEPLDQTTHLELPSVLECDHLPDTVDEIPTPEVALHHQHLQEIVDFIPPLSTNSKILLLIGRDLVEAHHVQNQIVGPPHSPYAQKLPLGWTIIGETCLGKLHHPDEARVKKTYWRDNDRLSIFPPCTNDMNIEETDNLEFMKPTDNFGENVFMRTLDDDKPGLSRDDRQFLEIMDNSFTKDNENWSAPLPFRRERQRLPNNSTQAYKRAKLLDLNLRRDPVKREHFFTFMKGIFDKGHAEIAPDIDHEKEQWYLPIFGVYHPKKPGKLRAVFDSSAKCDNISLNDVLLCGPDLTNSLLGVLLRFRREPVAIMADIEQMFYGFRVNEEHRDYLRFYWYTDNDFEKPLTIYRMRVHVFGNSPSPAVATYGLRKTAEEGEVEFGLDMKNFVTQDFYVDDGLTSQPTSKIAVDLMKRTQQTLQKYGNLRLHKISSNKEDVMNAFEQKDLAKELKDLDLDSDSLPMQRSLGMNWDLESDCFTYRIDKDIKPYTRRGVLSTINSVYDPLGFLAPVTIRGKQILRSVMNSQGETSWDDPLPPDQFEQWNEWRQSLHVLENLRLSRMFVPISFSSSEIKTVHIYSDASENAIAAVGYLQLDNSPNLGFIIGKAKVAPSRGHTIPRLELCGAVLATELGQIISDQLNLPPSDIRYHTDSKVVLGYIYNSSRRFYTYVSNRVAKIHKLSEPSQWSYVHTDKNPADVGTRSVKADELEDSIWLKGTLIRSDIVERTPETDTMHNLQQPDIDPEIRPEQVSCRKTLSHASSGNFGLGSERFERYSNWNSLVHAIAFLKRFVVSKGSETKSETACTFQEAELLVIKTVQREHYANEYESLESKKTLKKDSSLVHLNPYIDESGLLRVGGRINMANVSSDQRNPIIIPSKNWIATLIVRYHHDKIRHQGRHFTSGAVRTAGYWIVGEKRLISSILFKCVTCRKLRRNTEQQMMADLPKDRLQPDPPFTAVGLDTFGPWSVVTRRTRGGAANSKRWAIIFTCMATRGVHLEVVEDMSSSCFINAFRRFVSIRGDVRLIRSDRGTNFVGATDHLGINVINVEDSPIKNYLYENGVEWHFNSPHSSHMGGSWERMIRTTRNILNSMIAKHPERDLTHEVLVTFLAEVSAIINSRPLTCISSDSEEPFPLTPSLLITQKPNVLIPKDISFDCKDMYRSQWKRVQYLAEEFWRRWRVEYLQTLQTRRKWTNPCDNMQVGDVVLLKDAQVNRMSWPMGLVMKVFPSSDNLVRKAEVEIVRLSGNSATRHTFIRPVTELVVLLKNDSNSDGNVEQY